MTAPVPKESTLLPPLARKMLQDAARVKNTVNDPMARQRAIGIATKKIKQMYPLFFK